MEKRFKLAQQLRRESLKQELAAGLAGRQKANSNAAEGRVLLAAPADR